MADSKVEDEGGALIMGIIATVMILVLGAPCICYFGSGLYMGFDQLASGQYKNPARERKKKYARPEKYNRKFAKPRPTSPK